MYCPDCIDAVRFKHLHAELMVDCNAGDKTGGFASLTDI